MDACYFNRKEKREDDGSLTNVIEIVYNDGTVDRNAINSGFAYLFVPLCDNLPLLLFFQLHDTGHASDDTIETV